jgi:hypothetical protein
MDTKEWMVRAEYRRWIAIGAASVVAVFLPLMCGLAVAAASLPDGRAWEMVSPLEKNGGEINGIDGATPNEGLPEGGIVQAAADGGSITYLSLLAFPGSQGTEPKGAPIASQYLSRRAAGGWSTEDLTTAVNSGTYAPAGSGAPYRAFSSDLSLGLMQNGSPPPVENLPLTPDAPPRYEDYYVRENATGGFTSLLTAPPSEPPGEFFLALVGVTPDLTHVVVRTAAALTPGSTPQAGRNLFEWAGDRPQPMQPVNVEPGQTDQTAPGGSMLGMGNDESHTISNDGARVFWSQESTRSLFVRENIGTAQATTVQVDASREGEDPGGAGVFKTASSDGSKVFFTDRNRLTPGSTAGRDGAHEDLYMLDLNTNRLTDLTLDGDPGGASVLGVLEASEDGSYVYFVAEGALPGTTAVAGNDNLYVWHETSSDQGAIDFIAALSPDDNGLGGFHEPGVAHDWAPSTGERTTRVTPDGRQLVFMSDADLTGYDNLDANIPGQRDEEVYLYDAISGRLTCVSCNPSGERPIGPSGIPGGTAWRTVEELGTYQSRALSENGTRVFFDSRDALVSQDTNGMQDVYEWEQDGAGTCGSEGGCISLLSGATSTSDSSFVDASTSGSDVFFITRAQLVAQDTDQLRDLYDARVGGGFPLPPQPEPACEGESCLQVPSPPPLLGSLSSATFNGVGNIAPVPVKPAAKAKVKTKKRGKPKKGKKGKKRAKKAGHEANAKRSHGLLVRGKG